MYINYKGKVDERLENFVLKGILKIVVKIDKKVILRLENLLVFCIKGLGF